MRPFPGGRVDETDRDEAARRLRGSAGTVEPEYAMTTARETFLYGVVLSICATWYNVIRWHLIRSRAFVESVTVDRIDATVKAYRIGWLTYAAATLVALFVPLASFALYILIAAYYLIPGGIDDDLDGARPDAY